MHPEILSLSLFMLVTSCSPGPNNIVASYSGFNFGISKTIPHMLGVIFGFTFLVSVMNFGLINVFQKFPIIQESLKYMGSIFLIYLAYKISFSKNSSGDTKKNPVKFLIQPSTPTNKFLGYPLGLYVYSLSNDNPDERFDSWINKKPNRYARLSKILSEKQVKQLKKYNNSFNEFIKNLGQKPFKLSDSDVINSTCYFITCSALCFK